MPLTTQSKFNYLYNISTILERKNISRTVYEVMLSLQMTEESLERVTNGLKLSNNGVVNITVNFNRNAFSLFVHLKHCHSYGVFSNNCESTYAYFFTISKIGFI